MRYLIVSTGVVVVMMVLVVALEQQHPSLHHSLASRRLKFHSSFIHSKFNTIL